MFKDTRTTVTVIVSLIAYLVAVFGIQVDTATQVHIVGVALFVLGLLSRDSANGGKD